LTALGVGGLAVALALQGVLSNIFSGLEIIASHHIRPGDYIKLDMGSEGFVMDINWRNTTIRDVTNTLIIVPNDKLASSVIWNYNLPRKDVYTIAIDVPVPRDSDLDRVEGIATEVARRIVSDMLRPDEKPPEPEPYVRFSAIAADQVTVTTYLQARH
jgi:small-conductance mechanosensitive channel